MGELRKLNTFLDTKLNEDQLKNVAQQTGFTEMKARKAVFGCAEERGIFANDELKAHGGFFREGEIHLVMILLSFNLKQQYEKRKEFRQTVRKYMQANI